jgi:hypothetical protein
MTKLITTRQRLDQAKVLIQKARELPVPPGLGSRDLAFVAQVKDVLHRARDLIKFIQYSPSLTTDIKNELSETMDQMVQAEKEILHKE